MKTLKYIALAALTLSFAACEQEDINPAVQGDPDAVKINATICALQTRVAYSGDNGVTNFVNGDAIKVVNLMRTSKNEATYTTTDGTNWTTTDAMVWNSSSKNTFQAWYPVAEYSSYDTFTIPTDQSDATKLASADWMTVSTEEMAKPANGVLDLNFQHRLAKVTVTVTEEASQFLDPSLKSAVIYSLATDNVTVDSDNNSITPYQEDKSVTAIVCPGKYVSGTTFMKVTITDANNDYELNVPVNSYLTDTGLTGGKHYTFDLKVGKDIVSIGKVMVADWNNGGTIDGGVAEEVILTYEYDATTSTYKVYQGEYLQTAIDEAELTGTTENPATVKIMRDMEVIGIPNEYEEVEQDLLMDAGEIVLDLNGHTLTGKTGWATINIGNGAKLTIDDSSESKSGKIQNLLNDAVHVNNGSTLVVNNGTFEGVYAVYGFDSTTIVINGGTFKATKNAIYPQDANLTITGGTFDGGEKALYFKSATIALIAGGSFTGGECDIFTGGPTGFLSYNADGVGPTFPGGLSIYVYTNCPTLTDLLANGAAYYDSSGNQLTLADAATSCEGDVTVKKIPTDE